jgi:hypothetical protein
MQSCLPAFNYLDFMDFYRPPILMFPYYNPGSGQPIGFRLFKKSLEGEGLSEPRH